MSIGEALARKRVLKDRESRAVTRVSLADETVTERTALLHLAIFAALSVAVYYLALVRPFSLQRLWMTHQLDLDRLGAVNPAAHWLVLGGLIAEGLLYYLGWRAVQNLRGHRVGWVVVLLGALASGAVLLYFYPLASTDIWDYIIHGRMLALHNANPFVRVAAQYPQDVFAWYAGWPFDTSAYGPYWEVLAAATARLAGNNVIDNVVAFKLLVGIFLLASVGTVAMILRKVAPERALTGAFLVAWNPLVLYETIGNGHNDIVMVFWMLVAVHMMLDRRYTIAILALVAGTLVKFIPVLMIPAAGLIALRDLPGWRSRALFLVTTAVAGVVLIVVAYQPFWTGPQVLGMARRQQMYISSIPAAVVAYLLPKMGWHTATLTISKIAGALTVLYALFEGFRGMRDRSWHSFARSAFNVSMFYLLVTCMWFWPWYAIWPLALAAVLPPGHTTRLAQVFVIAALSKPLVFAPLYTWNQPPLHNWIWQQLRLGPSVMALPIIYLLYAFFAKLLVGLQEYLAREQPAAQAPALVAVAAHERYQPRADSVER